jgi:hypothetical protein
MRRKRAPREGAKNSIAGIAFDEIWVRQCTLGQLDILEAAMIKKHQPKHNTIYQPPVPPMPIEELMRLVPTYPHTEVKPATPRSVYRRF